MCAPCSSLSLYVVHNFYSWFQFLSGAIRSKHSAEKDKLRPTQYDPLAALVGFGQDSINAHEGPWTQLHRYFKHSHRTSRVYHW